MKIAFALIAPLALAACATTSAGSASSSPAPDGTLVALGEPVRVGSLVVTPEEVAEDSRCPMNARCIWAGRVVLVTRVAGADWTDSVLLTLGEPNASHGVALTLTSATPEHMTGQTTEPKDYRFGFEGGR